MVLFGGNASSAKIFLIWFVRRLLLWDLEVLLVGGISSSEIRNDKASIRLGNPNQLGDIAYNIPKFR